MLNRGGASEDESILAEVGPRVDEIGCTFSFLEKE